MLHRLSPPSDDEARRTHPWHIRKRSSGVAVHIGVKNAAFFFLRLL